MTCEHLIALEQELINLGFRETFRGQAWSDNAREWVYFEVCLDRDAVVAKFAFDPCVRYHAHLGTHDGQEAGFECVVHNDGIMGWHPAHCGNKPRFP